MPKTQFNCRIEARTLSEINELREDISNQTIGPALSQADIVEMAVAFLGQGFRVEGHKIFDSGFWDMDVVGGNDKPGS